MFEVIDKLPFNDATQIVHYAINEIKNPHVTRNTLKNQISYANRLIAKKLIKEAKINTSPDESINVLYSKLIELAKNQNLIDEERGISLLEGIKVKTQNFNQPGYNSLQTECFISGKGPEKSYLRRYWLKSGMELNSVKKGAGGNKLEDNPI